ncbi:hypothetical protein MML48_3g00014143 [Holotrichia oblita]|uniref:Uncharacterized protein n=1 Tax=Holotrichia oblita TaxID=644536 RepID=A0ACB9TGL9_HOLOL|nr:hypothetical protein MML48_3g00014143 [Holotrichia oblita]
MLAQFTENLEMEIHIIAETPEVTLEEAIQMAYVDDIDVHEIYIEPSDANILTDEDSGEEDGGAFLDNLSGQQLLLKAELVLRGTVTVDEAEPEDILVRPFNGSDRNDVFLRPGLEKITWIQGDFEEKSSIIF